MRNWPTFIAATFALVPSLSHASLYSPRPAIFQAEKNGAHMNIIWCEYKKKLGSVRSSKSDIVLPSVHHSSQKLSWAFNLHLSGYIPQVFLAQTYNSSDGQSQKDIVLFFYWLAILFLNPPSLFSLISKIFQGFAFLIPLVSGFQEPRDWLRLKDEATQHKLQNDGHREEQNHNTFGN